MRQVFPNGVGVRFLFIVLFIVTFSTVSAAKSDSGAAKLLEAAEVAGKGNDPAAKEELCRKIIAEFPNTVEAVTAYRDVAILCIQSRRTDEAKSLVESLKTECFTFPGTVDALYSVAQHWQWNGQPDQAIRLHRYNSATYSTIEKGMWSQGAIIHYFIEQRDFANALAEFEVMVDRFKEQATFPQEVYQFALKYHRVEAPEKALELHRYNVNNSPVSSKFTMWSQGAIVHYLIEQKDFASAQRELEVMLDLFQEQPTLPQEIHQTAEKYRTTGELDRAFELHRFNTLHSPASSKYTMWSQGALIHHFIEQGGFHQADYEYKVLLERFSDQPTLPQEIYVFALKYNGAGETDKALELHRYNSAHSPATSLHAMQSQGAIAHHYIETKNFEAAQREIDFMASRFSEQDTFPQELYQFAMKYNGVGETDKALELHRYNAAQSPASSKYAMWSQGALIHHYIAKKDFANAQAEFEVMVDRFKEQATFPQEIGYIADKYQGAGQYKLSRSLCQYGLVTFSDTDSKLNFKGILIKILLAESDYEQAALACEESLALCTNNSQIVKVLTNLGHIYQNEKLWSQALLYFQEALIKASVPNEQLDAYTGIAMVSARQGDDAKVWEIIDLLMMDYPDHDRLGYTVFIIGEEYYLMGLEKINQASQTIYVRESFSKSIEIWKTVVARIPQSSYAARSIRFIGELHFRQKDFIKAIPYYIQLFQDWPDSHLIADALQECGACYNELSKLNSLTENETKDASLIVDALAAQDRLYGVMHLCFAIGELHYKREQWQDALRYLEYYVDTSKEIGVNPDVYYILAQSYEKVTQVSKAVVNYRRYINNTSPEINGPRWLSAHKQLERLISQ